METQEHTKKKTGPPPMGLESATYRLFPRNREILRSLGKSRGSNASALLRDVLDRLHTPDDLARFLKQ